MELVLSSVNGYLFKYWPVSLILIKLYLRSKSPTTEPSSPTALRDVKEAFRRGQGSTEVLVQ